jgi:hypothetical protein
MAAFIIIVALLLLAFHTVIILRNHGYKIQRIDHHKPTKYTGA